MILNSYLKVPFHIVCYYKYNLDANSDDAAYHNQMNQMDTDGNAWLGKIIMDYQLKYYKNTCFN